MTLFQVIDAEGYAYDDPTYATSGCGHPIMPDGWKYNLFVMSFTLIQSEGSL
jgi:hypothetical protein